MGGQTKFRFDIGVDIFARGRGITNVAFLLDANTEQLAFFFQIPKTGTITNVCYRLGTIGAGGGADLKVALKTPNGDGTPSATDYGGSTEGTETVADTDDDTVPETALGTNASAVEGDWVFVLFDFDAGTPNIEIDAAAGSTAARMVPRTMSDLGGGWVWSPNSPMVALKYADGTYATPPGCYPPVTWDTTVFYSASSSPDEYGMRFKPPVDCVIKQARYDGFRKGTSDTVAGFQCFVIDDQGTDIASTKKLTLDQANTGVDYHASFAFTTPVVLQANRYYYVTLRPDTAGESVRNYRYVVTDLKFKPPLEKAMGLAQVTRTDAGAWTTDELTVPLVTLEFESVEWNYAVQFAPAVAPGRGR